MQKCEVEPKGKEPEQPLLFCHFSSTFFPFYDFYGASPNALRFSFILASISSAALKGSGSITKQAPTNSSRPERAIFVTISAPVILGGCPRWV